MINAIAKNKDGTVIILNLTHEVSDDGMEVVRNSLGEDVGFSDSGWLTMAQTVVVRVKKGTITDGVGLIKALAEACDEQTSVKNINKAAEQKAGRSYDFAER